MLSSQFAAFFEPVVKQMFAGGNYFEGLQGDFLVTFRGIVGIKVMEAFLSAVDEQGGTLILVTHNAGWARRGGLTELPFVMEEDEQGLTAVLDDRRDEALSPPDPAPAPARGSSC